jgi:hypothetical protein
MSVSSPDLDEKLLTLNLQECWLLTSGRLGPLEEQSPVGETLRWFELNLRFVDEVSSVAEIQRWKRGEDERGRRI